MCALTQLLQKKISKTVSTELKSPEVSLFKLYKQHLDIDAETEHRDDYSIRQTSAIVAGIKLRQFKKKKLKQTNLKTRTAVYQTMYDTSAHFFFYKPTNILKISKSDILKKLKYMQV